MCQKYTFDELNTLDNHQKEIICTMQERLSKLEDDYEKLMEQIRIANSKSYGRSTERLETLDGQLSLFNEVEASVDTDVTEPDIEDIIEEESKNPRKSKQKGKRDEDLKDWPEEPHPHNVTEEQLIEYFGEGNYKPMPSDHYKRLRFEPAHYTVEHHVVEVYVGTGGDHQDEFLRGDRPKDLLRNSIITPSLEAAIINGKYVNALPLDRIEQEFSRNGLSLSKQTMSNWTINCTERYLVAIYERILQELLTYHVNQCDETTVEVIRDDRPAGSKSYMWIHRSGEYYKDKPIVVYEYQKTRSSVHPIEFYKSFNGILLTDSLEQYHKLGRELEGVTVANCWAHARRDYSDAVKAIGKSQSQLVKRSLAYQALVRIAAIYKLDNSLKEMTSEERLRERQNTVKPFVEEYFAWVKGILSDNTILVKGKTADGLRYSVNQEEYLKVFLTDGDIPIDNSASERALRGFTIGRKNWMIINTIRDAKTSAVLYSITETAKLNNLNPYQYIKHLLTELPKLCDKEGNIDRSKLDSLLPWSNELPNECHSKRRE